MAGLNWKKIEQELNAQKAGKSSAGATPQKEKKKKLDWDKINQELEQKAAAKKKASAGSQIDSALGGLQTVYDDFAKLYQSRYADKKDYFGSYRPDSQQWFNRATGLKKQWNQLLATVNAYIKDNAESLDPAETKKLRTWLQEADKGIRGMWGSAAQEQDFYSNFDDAAAFDNWQKETEKRTIDVAAARKELEEEQSKYALFVQAENQWADAQQGGAKRYVPYEKGMTQEAYNAALRAYNAEKEKNVTAYREKYGSPEEMKKTLKAREVYLNDAERIQNDAKLSAVADPSSELYDPEFESWAKKRKYGIPTREDLVKYEEMTDATRWNYYTDGKMRDGYGTIIDMSNRDEDGNVIHPLEDRVNHDTTDKLGMFLSASEGEREITNIDGLGAAWGKVMIEGNSKNWAEINEDEISLYYYYLNKDGWAAAEKYLDSIQETLNWRKGSRRGRNMDGKFLEQMLFQVEAGLDQFAGSMEGLRNSILGEKKYVPTSATQFANAEVMEDLENVDLKWYDFKEGTWNDADIFGKSLGQTMASGISTVANMAPSILTSIAAEAVLPGSGAVVGNIMMGGSAAGGAYQEKINAGYSAEEAKTYGALVGASEAALNYLLGGIGGLAKEGTGSLARVFKNVGKIDDVFTKFSKSGAGKVLLGAGSEAIEEGLQSVIEPYLWHAVSGEEVTVDVQEALYSALLGAMTGGMFEGTSAISGSLAQNAQYAQIGKEVLGKEGGLDALTALAMDMQSESPELSKLLSAVEKKATQKNVGKLQSAVSEAYRTQSSKNLTARLQENGFSPEVAEIIGGAMMTAATNPEALTQEQRTYLTRFLPDARVQAAANAALETAPDTAPNAETAPNLAEETAQMRKETPESYKIESLEGKTFQKSSGQAVNVQKFAEIAPRQATVTLDDGRVIPASDVSFENVGEDVLFHFIHSEDNMTPEGANAAWQLWQVNKNSPAPVSADTFRAAMIATWRAGYKGDNTVLNTKNGAVAALSQQQRELIYQAARRAAQVNADTAQANIDAVYAEAKNVLQERGQTKQRQRAVTAKGVNVKKMNRKQRASYRLAEQIAPGIQAKIEVYDGGAEWGHYDHNTDTIRLNINANWDSTTMLAFTLGHELAHRAKRGSPDAFKAFADFLISEYGKQGADIDGMVAEQIAAAKEQGIEMSEDAAFEEVVADACQKMLIDTDAGKRLAEFGARSAGNRNYLHKIKQWLTELLEYLRKAFRNVELDSAAARAFTRLDENVKQILADMFVDMSIDAGEKLSTIQTADLGKKITAQNDGSFKYKTAVRYDYSKSFAEQVEDYKTGKIPKGDTLVVGATPEVFRLIGFNAIPMTINTTHVDYALNGTKDADHYVGEAFLKQLPESIKRPVAIFVSRTHGTASVIALLDFKVNGKQVVAPVAIDGFGRQNTIQIDSNAITSIYGKTTAIKQLNQALQEEATGKFALLYANKKEAISLLHRAGHQLSGTLIPHDGFIHSIREIGSPVNMKFQNVTETQQFKRWFGDWKKHPNKASKIVNTDGTPMVVYHGTNAKFSAFDKRFAKNGVFGKGFYFAPSKGRAGAYGSAKVLETYLAVRTPYVVRDSMGFTAEDYWDMQKQFGIQDKITDQNVDKILQQHGYDGIIAEDGNGRIREIVAFEPTQIKSASDNIGTFDGNNPDIRYKLPVSRDVSDRAMLADMFEQMVTNSNEYKALEYYRKHMDEMLKLEEQLERVTAEIRRLSFAEGPRDTETLNRLKLLQKKTVNRLNYYDNLLLGLEKSGVLKAMIERNRKKITQESFAKAKEYYRERNERRESEIRQYYRESRRQAVERHDKAEIRQRIRKDVERLNSLLNKGNKNKNVKQGLQEFVGAALRLAKGSFLMDYNEYDMVRNGLQNKLLPEEQAAFDRCRELMKELDKLRDEKSMEPIADSIHDKWDPEAELRKKDREEALKKELAKNMRVLRDGNVFQRERASAEDATAEQLPDELLGAYQKLAETEFEHLQGLYSQKVYEQIEKVKDFLKGKAIKDMTTIELMELQKMYRMVGEAVSRADELFGAHRNEKTSKRGDQIINQLATDRDADMNAVVAKLNEFGWSLLTPEAAAAVIGSKELTQAIREVEATETVHQEDLEHARQYAAEQTKKFNRKNWDTSKQVKFAGTEITIGQAMALFAYTERKAGRDHISGDGFVHSKAVPIKQKLGKLQINSKFIKDTTRAYRVTEDMYNELGKLLTEEQKGYARAMRDYLAEVMGAKGNEVSVELYGIEMYGEKSYFPLKSAKNFLDSALGAKRGEVKVTNQGFTKSLQEGASNAIVLEDFEIVWARHVQEMSNYHACAVAMENFNRLYNYRRTEQRDTTNKWGQLVTEEVKSSEPVSLHIERRAVGGTGYLVKWMESVNGGVRSDATDKLLGGLLGNFRKTAVLGNISVIIQQPTAILRAVPYLGKDILSGWKTWKITTPEKGLIREMYRYCPVAGLKKMGGFDPAAGQTVRQYLFDGRDNAKGKLKKIQDNINEWLGKGPEKADELAWSYLWLGCKKKTLRENRNLRAGSKEHCEAAAELFTRIVRETQVYDSVMSKPLIMQSKNAAIKGLTSFMNEPLKGLNQCITAIAREKNGEISKGNAAKHILWVSVSNLLARTVSSLIYALRDDDEDETYWEKYRKHFAGGLLDVINPLSSVPVIKEIFSIAKGYGNERSEFAVISDAWNGMQKLFTESKAETPEEIEKEVWDKLEKGLGNISNLFGIPGRNLIREVRGIYYAWKRAGEVEATAAGVRYAWREGFTGKEVSKAEQLYNAVVEDDGAHLVRVMATWDDPKTAVSNMVSAVKDAYLTSNITDDRATEYLMEFGGKSLEEVSDYLSEWEFKKAYPDSGLEDSKARNYIEIAAPAGISMDMYERYIANTADLEGDKDEEGKTIPNSKREKVWAEIDKLPLSKKQKDALHYAAGYRESSLDEAPWN